VARETDANLLGSFRELLRELDVPPGACPAHRKAER
jgi:hypothetical protein